MTTTPARTPAPALDRLFSILRRSPVTRSSSRAIAGVCAGIADRLGVSTGIVRVGAVVAAIFGPALVLYLAAWLLLPDAFGRIRLERAVREGDFPSIALLIVTVLAVLPEAGLHHMAWLPLLVVGVVVVASRRGGLWRHPSSRGGQGSTWHHPRQGTQAPPSTPQGPTGSDGTPQDAPRA